MIYDLHQEKGFPCVYRSDVLRSNLTASKEAEIFRVLRAYRRGTVLMAQEQWRRFFETGRFDKFYSGDRARLKAVVGNSKRVESGRIYVAGQLSAFVSNRANDFRRVVSRSSLPLDVKHQLFFVNSRRAWFLREPLTMPSSDIEISLKTRHLARVIMRHQLKRHRQPNFKNAAMPLAKETGRLERPHTASQLGKVAWWASVSSMQKGRVVKVPLLWTTVHARRQGKASVAVCVQTDRNGCLKFVVTTDIGRVCAQQRSEYQGTRDIALRFGMRDMFTSDCGGSLGRDWLGSLKKYERGIADLASGLSRRGINPRQSGRYVSSVARMRGFVRTEVGRVLNRIVEKDRPRNFILEHLDFSGTNFSGRMNAVFRNCGVGAVKQKLNDFNDRFGIESHFVYRSFLAQTCSVCGYVDDRNIAENWRFHCLWCGNKLQSDLNAARNIGKRRAFAKEFQAGGKAAILAELVRQFRERPVRAFGPCKFRDAVRSEDPRLSNPYFTDAGLLGGASKPKRGRVKRKN